VFERFTTRARRVVVLAQEEARLLAHDDIGAEHLLLGLLAVDDGIAAAALHALGVSLESARAAVADLAPPGEHGPVGHIPFTSEAKRVLEASLREALDLRTSSIDTQHLLLGITRVAPGTAVSLLGALGVQPGDVRREVLERVRGGTPMPATAGGVLDRPTSPPAPLSAFGVAPGRRCSFCFRPQERVERMVRGRAARICDECLVRASDLVANAGEESPRQLRLRPPFLPQAQTEGAEVAVERAFETVFGSGASVDERLALVEDSGDLRAVVQEVVAVHRVSGDPDVWVDSVRFVGAEEAEVRWSPVLAGGARLPMLGFAVLDGGVWKVSRNSYHQVASPAGVPVPPPEAVTGE